MIAVQRLIFSALLLVASNLALSGPAQVQLSGTVFNDTIGAPRYPISIVEPTENKPPLTTQADDDGHFAFSNLTPGVYQLNAGKLVFIVDLSDGRPVKIDVYLPIDERSKASGEVQTTWPSSPRLTGRDFLDRDLAEEPGYGLYSYFLFSSKPATKEEKARYLVAVRAFIQYIDEMKTYKPDSALRKGLNVTYLPVCKRPRTGSSPEEALDDYNYARSKLLLANFDGKLHLGGPYLISTLKPLSTSSRPEHFLFQDLSDVPPSVIVPWLKEFTVEASKGQFWTPEPFPQAVLKTRDWIGNMTVAAAQANHALRQVKAELGTLIRAQ